MASGWLTICAALAWPHKVYDLIYRMWQGLGGQINHFRKRQLLLGHLHRRMAPSVLDELQVPWTYCWSPALLPKPSDWRDNIEISGFYFLGNDVTYNPPSDLARFLALGAPPIYIGFGSIPIPDVEATMGEFPLAVFELADTQTYLSTRSISAASGQS
jgi:UDP:flavonoid glycosyltransferase YjiC (YdhE family)